MSLEVCRICFNKNEEYVEIFSDEGCQRNVKAIVEQHFWFKIEQEDEDSKQICSICWQIIESFHNFYTKINTIHNSLIPNSSFETHFVKLEIDVGDELTTEIKTEIDEISEVLEQPTVADQGFLSSNESSDTEDFDGDVSEYGSNNESESTDSDEEEIRKPPKRRQTRSKKIKKEEDSDFKQNDSDDDNDNEDQLQSNEDFETKRNMKNISEKDQELQREQLQTENQLIHEYFTMQCEHCPERFEDFISVVKHYRQAHNKRGYLICCSRKFFRRCEVLQHIQLHIDPEAFKCKICDKKLRDQHSLDRHKLSAHSDEPLNFQCDLCPKKYSTVHRMEEHKAIHNEKSFVCEDCGKGYYSKSKLNNHIRIHHEETYRFICEICARSFKSKLQFEKHHKTAHNKQSKQQCTLCGIWLKHERSFKRHQLVHEKNDEVQVCNVCGKKSSNLHDHKKHINYMHGTERTHVCEICNKAFKRSGTLQEHMLTHTENAETTKNVSVESLPEKSRRIYERRYEKLMDWCEKKEIELVNENVLMDYFTHLSKDLKSSSLWLNYSMLRSTLLFHENIDISQYSKLLTFLKQKSCGFSPTTSKMLRKEDILKFLLEAPDDKYLLKKVVLIIGVFGACRRNELVNLKIDDVEDYEKMLLIKLPSNESNVQRNFTICNDEYIGLDLVALYRKYIALRPPETITRRLFISYNNGLCNDHVVGRNAMAKIPSEVASYLKLPDATLYTGHCFRKSFELLQKNAKDNILTRKRKIMGKSSTPAEGNVDDINEDETIDGQDFSMDEENENTTYAKSFEMSLASENILIDGVPTENAETPKSAPLNFLPKKTRITYEKRYKHYKDWCAENKMECFTENCLTEYFTKLSKELKSSSLWSIYSMIRSTSNFRDNVDISQHRKLLEFLKQQSTGHVVKTSKTFRKEDIHKFLLEAPDEIYLLKKIVLIIGVFGACRCDELVQLAIDDIEDYDTMLLIKLTNTESNTQRTFTICNDDSNGWDLMALYKKYIALRPKTAHTRRFFLRYSNGVCFNQVVGKYTIGKVPSDVANYLKLSDPASYTGHCYRKSSASLRANSRCDITTLTRHGLKKSSNPTEGGIDDTNGNEMVSDPNSTDNIPIDELSEDPDAVRGSLESLPKRTRKVYEQRYKLFTDWCAENKMELFTEDALIGYFTKLSKDHKSSSLWSIFSMLRSTLTFRDNVDITQYKMLVAYLKKQSSGYRSIPFKTLSKEDIQKFLLEAPDDIYLLKKVALIIGIVGACRCEELVKITIDDIQYYETMVHVTIKGTKAKKQRTFTICNDEYNCWNFMALYRKYVSLRPKAVDSRRFFLRYAKGVCVNQVVGMNTIGKVPSEVAKYLKLPEPTLYTGHSFRKSSAPLLANAEGTSTTRKRNKVKKSTVVTETITQEPYTISTFKTSVSPLPYQMTSEYNNISIFEPFSSGS